MHFNFDPLSDLLKVTCMPPPSPADVILIVPKYHWYIAVGNGLEKDMATHVNDCCFPAITLTGEESIGVDVSDTFCTGASKLPEKNRIVNMY